MVNYAEAEDAKSRLREIYNKGHLYVPEPSSAETCIPGIGDVFLRRINRLGHKDIFPRNYDWENLLPQLNEEEELLWVVRKNGGQRTKELEKQGNTHQLNHCGFEIYLGLKFLSGTLTDSDSIKGRYRRFEDIVRFFARCAFPESSFEKNLKEGEVADFINKSVTMGNAVAIVGMPSVKTSELKEGLAKRDEKARPFAGLNDILEMHDDTDYDFTLVFSVSRAPSNEIERTFGTLFAIQNQIMPNIEKIIQYSHSDNTSLTLSEGSTHTEGSSDTIKGGEKTVREQKGIGGRVVQHGGRFLQNCLLWLVGNESKWTPNDKEYINIKKKIQIGTSQSHSDSHQQTRSQTTGSAGTKSWSLKEIHAELSFAKEQIEQMIKQLSHALGTGGYYANAIVYSDDKRVAGSVANAVQSTLSGGQSSLFPMRMLPEEEDGVKFFEKDILARNKAMARSLYECGVMPPIINCEKASLYLPLPTTHLVGLPLKRNVFYGKDRVSTGHDEGFGRMSYGEPPIINDSKTVNTMTIGLKPSDFYSHFFIVGTTGSGKTTRAAQIISKAENFRRVIFETAKKTYWNELDVDPSDTIIYTLGDSKMTPLRINPFYFEPGSSLKQHISVLSDAISDLLPTEALIGPKLREAIEMSYKTCGWDIETSEWDKSRSICKLLYPNMVWFNIMVNDVASKMTEDYSADVSSNYAGALINRAAIFIDDIYQDIFSFDGDKTIDELFPEGKTVIIEMEEMPPSDINMPAFVISILLHRIRAYQNTRNANGVAGNGFLLAIEEAHNVLARKFEEKRDQAQVGKGGHLVNQVTRLLAEGRGLKIGLMVIDQSAVNIAPSVITNSNTKLVFRQEDGSEIETIGKAIGLKREEWNDLQYLEPGEYIIRNSGFMQPIKVAPISEAEYHGHRQSVQGRTRNQFFTGDRTPPLYCWMETLLEQMPFSKEMGLLISEECDNALLKCAKGNRQLVEYAKVRHLIRNRVFDFAKRELSMEDMDYD